MTKKSFSFSAGIVQYYFDASFSELERLVQKDKAIIITDENVFSKHKRKFTGWRTFVIKAGEEHKTQAAVDDIINQLIEASADRSTILVGIGGGVVTDITGYVGGIYMRGIRFGFVPTSILAMVDAAIGGKNGVDVGVYKNIVGLIRQPSFILYDYAFLKTLPREEWINGFAEVIKHGCIQDPHMFKLLEENQLSFFQKNAEALGKLIKQNATLKSKVVALDEFEQGDRRILNFGHTIGHAIENLYGIPHGHAVSIGMGVACKVSQKLTGFKETGRVIKLLKQYGLPPQFEMDKEAVLEVVLKDKKKDGKMLNMVLITKLGDAKVVAMPLAVVSEMLETFKRGNDY